MALALAENLTDLYSRVTRYTSPVLDGYTFGLVIAQTNLSREDKAELKDCLHGKTVQPLIASFEKLKQEFAAGDSIETSAMKFLRILESSCLAPRASLILDLPGGSNWLDSINALALHFDFYIQVPDYSSEDAKRRVITGLIEQAIGGPDQLRAFGSVRGFGSAEMLKDWQSTQGLTLI